ncbi:peptidylprolyl isomerase [Testudinibacter sp. TR-2022]|nr:peptidylprolyl isomerase [Testudinibacter sp. TR-2022]TNH03978.1 peptidylprolyl isomerase [Pasteurellaceae bacterium Phil31]TNH07666.1 peptidylprolyl isomerase [Testudinibacter sp. TR-2022]TNH09873.1 peptidylprolyl isomerase [Testudinibacter sp. TR-2022]TNH17302.1 peptidylprolyl isomerase [Testudinibacter sp. TR-2022]TNH18320.1 peptidylprolyl isomerase [Testudinibacter sp. TR-2022]
MPLHTSAAEKVVATVNGYPILASQVKKELGRKADNAANRQKALDGIIDDILVQQAIQESGVRISSAQVDKVFQSVAESNGLTWGQLLDVLDYQGVNYHEYRNQIAHQLLMNEVRQQNIGKSIDVTREQVETLGSDLQKQAEKRGTVKKHTAPEYRVRHILLKTNPILTDAKAKAELSKIRADILAKKTTFEAAAKANSKDYLSGDKGGDLGFAFPENYVPEFAKMVRSSKTGTITQPFKTEYGWHILEVTDTRKGDKTDDFYRQKAYEQIVNKQAQAESKNWVSGLRKRAQIKILN